MSVLALLEREKRKIRVAVFTQRRTQGWTAVGTKLEIGKGAVAFLPGGVLYLLGSSTTGRAALLIGGLLFAAWAGFICWYSLKATIDLGNRAYDKVTKFQLSREYWEDDRA